MSKEVFTIPGTKVDKDPVVFTPRAKRLGAAVAGLAVTAGAYFGISNLDTSPAMHGEQTVTVDNGDRLDDLINEFVDGGATHTGEVRVHVENDPVNADVFENGQLDPGEELVLPKSVE